MEPELKDLVRQHRRLSGLTMIELAKLAGVGKTVVFDIEHGKETVQLDTLKKVLAVLNLKLVFQSPVLDRTAKARAASPARP
jgi:transcriptional regulator with XRE-family HTH domain